MDFFTDLGDIAYPSLIGLRLLELPVQHTGRYRHSVFTVRHMNKFAPPNKPRAIDSHQGPHPVPALDLTACGHSGAQPATAVSLLAGCKGGFEVDAGSTHHWLDKTLLAHGQMGVVACATDSKDAASLADCGGLLLQVFNEPVHPSSRAKKAGAFFKMSTWPVKCWKKLCRG